ncbi:hypothetical protein B0H14DRAFT_2627898 [Mycena olivaceomarginata]|nr:hypothetical protein B0H14DRAFT_2627898 [Mycena olivaceomarginata]
MSSEPPADRATTPHNELLALTQQLTPSKTPRSRRQICQEIQSLANDATESHGAIKRKLADVTNQLGNPRPPRKRRMRHNRSAHATDDVENPATLEDRVRASGRHFVIEYGLFLFTNVHALLDTDVDPSFNEDTEFDSEDSTIQGQLRDVIALLPEDAKAIQGQDWIADSLGDGMSGQRSTINTRLRRESIVHIVDGIKFRDGNRIDVKNFESSASRFNAFAKRIGYQEATEDAAAFYSPLKAEVLFEEYDGTMNIEKIFRGPLLLKIYASIIRGPQGAKGLFEGNSKLPPAKVIQRLYHIERTTPAAIATCAVLAIWLFSSDDQIVTEGDETKIDYKYLFVTFLRQICEGLRDKLDWAMDLFRHWDRVLFPNAEHSHGQSTSANRQAVRADVDAMDAAFKAAVPHRENSPVPTPPRPSASSQRIGSPETERSQPRTGPVDSHQGSPSRAQRHNTGRRRGGQ